MSELLERLADRMTPEVLRALVEHLEGIEGSARSDIVLHHGPDGVARGLEAHKRTKTVDVRTSGGVASPR